MPGPRRRSRRFAPALLVVALTAWGCVRNRPEAPAASVATTSSTTTTISSTTTTTRPVVRKRQTYMLHRPSRWQVGDVVTNQIEATTKNQLSKVMPDGSTAPASDVQDTIEATWLEKCTEVDGDGRRVRFVVHVTAWSRTAGSARDESLKGAHLAVTPSESGTKWSLEEGTSTPTPEAKRWLNDHFGARSVGGEEWLGIVLPNRRVAAGQSWNLDPKQLADMFTGGGLEVDASRAKGTATLEAADRSMARCRFKTSLPLVHVPRSKGTWSKGGTVDIRGDMTLRYRPSLLILSKGHTETRLEGETTQNGETVRISLQSSTTHTTTPGGSFPELPPK